MAARAGARRSCCRARGLSPGAASRRSLRSNGRGRCWSSPRRATGEGNVQPLEAAPWNPRGYCNNQAQRVCGAAPAVTATEPRAFAQVSLVGSGRSLPGLRHGGWARALSRVRARLNRDRLSSRPIGGPSYRRLSPLRPRPLPMVAGAAICLRLRAAPCRPPLPSAATISPAATSRSKRTSVKSSARPVLPRSVSTLSRRPRRASRCAACAAAAAARRRPARSATIPPGSCGMRAAGVPGRAE